MCGATYAHKALCMHSVTRRRNTCSPKHMSLIHTICSQTGWTCLTRAERTKHSGQVLCVGLDARQAQQSHRAKPPGLCERACPIKSASHPAPERWCLHCHMECQSVSSGRGSPWHLEGKKARKKSWRRKKERKKEGQAVFRTGRQTDRRSLQVYCWIVLAYTARHAK